MPERKATTREIKKKERINKKMKAYCMKCRKEVEIKNPKTVKMRNGKPAMQGLCQLCGTRVFRIGESK